MSNWKPFKDIVGYLDELHADISQFAVLVEKMMLEKGYISLPTAGNQSNYSSVSSHYMSPEKWRAPYITRMFVLEEEELPSRSLFYLVMLKTTRSCGPVVLSRCGSTIKRIGRRYSGSAPISLAADHGFDPISETAYNLGSNL